jgi:protocatechuate 3,4-dioxygenase beta subunit
MADLREDTPRLRDGAHERERALRRIDAVNRNLLLLGAALLAVAGGVAGIAHSAFEAPEPPAPPEHVAPAATPACVFGEIRRVGDDAVVAEQRVALASVSGPPRETATDAQGVFRFAGVAPGGPYELRVDAADGAKVRVPGLGFDAGELRDLGTLRLGPAVRVVVRVRTWADEPIAGAHVEAYRVVGEDLDWSISAAQSSQPRIAVAVAAADARGDATFADLADGKWTFAAEAPGFAREGVRDFRVRAAANKPLAIRLDAGRAFTGRVLDADGAPLAGWSVFSAHEKLGFDAALRTRSQTAADGRFAFDSVADGETWIYVARPGGAPFLVAKVRTPDVNAFDVRLPRGGALRGTIVDADAGTPIAEAVVRIADRGWGGARVVEATSDAQGRYEIASFAGYGDVVVVKDGFVDVGDGRREHASFTLRDGDAFTRDFRLRRGVRLAGVVTSPAGPVSGAVVAARGVPRFRFGRWTTTTDADGRYEFACVVAGPVHLTEKKAGFADPDFDEFVRHDDDESTSPLVIDVAASGDTRKDLELAPGGVVEGRVVGADGLPLAGVEVSTWTAPDSTITAADGSFRLARVPPGDCCLECKRDGFDVDDPPELSVKPGGPVSGLVLRMIPRIAVRGRVRTADGAVPTGARVTVAWSRGVGDFEHDGGDGPVPVLASGEYRTGVDAHATVFDVHADAPGFVASKTARTEIVAGRTEYAADIVLSPGVAVAGRVVAKDRGAPIAGASVLVERRADASSLYGTPWDVVRATTDEKGEFNVAHLAPGRYLVGVEAAWFVSDAVDVDAAEAARCTIELQRPLAIDGVVRFADGRPAEGVVVRAQGATSRMAFRDVLPDRTQATVDAVGRFRITDLPAGRFRLRAFAPFLSTLGVRNTRIDDVAAGSRDVAIEVELGGTITGRVLDARGAPLAGIGVVATPAKGTWEDDRRAQSKADGSFTIIGCDDCEYDVEADDARRDGPGHQAARVERVWPGHEPLTFALVDALTISGVVVDGGGKAVPFVELTASSDARNAPGRRRGTSTDKSGAFTIGGLAPGGYRIAADNESYAPAAFVFDADAHVEAGAPGLRLVASKSVSIEGGVVDETGKPVFDAKVTATSSDEVERAEAKSDDDGAFELLGLSARGRYVLETSATDRVADTRAGVAGGARGLVIILERGLAVAGRVLDAAGRPLARTNFGVRPVGGKAMKYADTDADGRFRIEGLARGAFEAWVFPPSNGAAKAKAVLCGTVRAGDLDATLRAEK